MKTALSTRRKFLGTVWRTAGFFLSASVFSRSVTAGDFTEISAYLRIPGSPAPPVEMNAQIDEAWICHGESLELWWVTTEDVNKVDLGVDLGVFPADKGGSGNGFKWGSILVSPEHDSAYEVSSLDGDFEAANTSYVKVFGNPTTIKSTIIEEAQIITSLTRHGTVREDSTDEWAVTLPYDRYSENLIFRGVKPIGASSEGLSESWRAVQTEPDGSETVFSFSPKSSFQYPFADNESVNIEMRGDWSFFSRANITGTTAPFMVRVICR